MFMQEEYSLKLKNISVEIGKLRDYLWLFCRR